MIKILQTPIRFFPYIGGVEFVALYLSIELVKLGFIVKVICANEPYTKMNKYKGILIKRLPYLFKITNTNICLTLPYHLLKEEYDIVQTYIPTPWTSDLSVLIAKIRKKKSVVFIQNDLDKPGILPKLITFIYLHTLFKITLYLTDKIIVVNENWAISFSNTKIILEKYKSKIIEIPNGVDTQIFKQLHIQRDRNTILFVSILDKHHKFKGLDYLLESVKQIASKNPKIKLIVVGEGELKDYYQKRVKTEGYAKNVEFVGSKSQIELVKLYNRAGVFVLPSIEIEGFGIVAIEAMACGVPIITTDIVGTSAEIKKNKIGIIIKPKDTSALSEAITELLSNETFSIECSENGRKLIQEKYDWKLVGNQISEVYKKILQ